MFYLTIQEPGKAVLLLMARVFEIRGVVFHKVTKLVVAGSDLCFKVQERKEKPKKKSHFLRKTHVACSVNAGTSTQQN